MRNKKFKIKNSNQTEKYLNKQQKIALANLIH